MASASTPAADPFTEVLKSRHRWYVHPLSTFVRLWDSFVKLPIAAYFIFVAPLRIGLHQTQQRPVP